MGSPDFPGDGTLADGEYYGALKSWDPTNPGVAVFAVYQLDDCARPEMGVVEECRDVVEYGRRFEIGSEYIEIEVPLDENLWVMVLSNAEDLADPTILAGRTAYSTGWGLRDLLITLRADFTTFIDPLIESGATFAEVATALTESDAPFAAAPLADEYTMARWYREGYPALSYGEGMRTDPEMITPTYYDNDAKALKISTFDLFIRGVGFIRGGGSFEKKNGVISFTYAWEFIGG